MSLIAKYKLKKDLPSLEKGVIFEHREYDNHYPDRGNPGTGVMILGWINGSCQGGWCGETFIFPGQLSKDSEWFEKIEPPILEDKKNIDKELKEEILKEIDNLKQKVEKLL